MIGAFRLNYPAEAPLIRQPTALAAFSAVNFPIAAKRNRNAQLAQSIQHSTETLPQVGYLTAGAGLGLLEVVECSGIRSPDLAAG
jgi:hypothetical protein